MCTCVCLYPYVCECVYVCTCMFVPLYVIGFEKTLLMGFFVKIEFDASLISSTIELTHLQVLG